MSRLALALPLLSALLFSGASAFAAEARGDANADNSVDVADVFFLAQSLFGGGPDAIRSCLADVDASQTVDVADVFYLVNFLFSGGTAPPPQPVEVCNTTDDDCDGQIDDGVSTTFYRDADGDGYGSGADFIQACSIEAGYLLHAGDCNDSNPAINPDAFEVSGNAADDDCDGAIDPSRPPCDGGFASNASDPLLYGQAMDLCQLTTEIAPPTGRKWGLISAQFSLASGTGTPAAASRSIRPVFGSANFPHFGNAFAVLSTGHAATPGQVNPSFSSFQGGPAMGTQSPFPADWLAANGNALPTAPGCPGAQGSAAVDPVMLTLRVRVPLNARSFSLSSRFFSAEYPEYVCSPFNDFFVVLLDSAYAGVPANPTDKNLALYTTASGTYPVAVNLASGNTGLFQACKNGATGCANLAVSGNITTCTGTTDLAGTGFDVANPPPAPESIGQPGYCGTNNLLGGGTPWLTIRGNVVPGETITLRLAVWDTSDGAYDSLVLVDDFRWSTANTTAGAFLEE